MVMLLRLKDCVDTWQKVGQTLHASQMDLYRFRKTGKMAKWRRILFYMLLNEWRPDEDEQNSDNGDEQIFDDEDE